MPWDWQHRPQLWWELVKVQKIIYLIKDAESLELGYKVNAVILDKTGTITEGKPLVTDILWKDKLQNKSEYKKVLLAIETQSEHPLAEAVVNHLKDEKVEQAEIASFESITGKGVKAQTENGSKYYVGNHKLMVEKNIQIDASLIQTAESLEEQAKTVIFFGNEKQVLAILAIADKIKETSKKAIATLQERGIEVYMLTGDNNKTASAVAKQVGITNYQGEVMPSDKAAFVEKLQAEGKIVAMVGDGINDSHALAQANVSIAMGKGSDIAMDVAKMTLITSDLQSIPKSIGIIEKNGVGHTSEFILGIHL